MKALFTNLATNTNTVMNFATESDMQIAYEKMRMESPTAHINLYYNEAVASTPIDHIMNVEGCDLGFTTATWNIMWECQMEQYPKYVVYSTEAFIKKCEALRTYHANLIAIGNWRNDYALSDYYTTVMSEQPYLASFYAEAVRSGYINSDLEITLAEIRANRIESKAIALRHEQSLKAKKIASAKKNNAKKNTIGNMSDKLEALKKLMSA